MVALLAHGTRTRPVWTGAATATAETCSRDANLSTCMDDFGVTIARCPAAGASSSQSGGTQSSFSLHQSALMARRGLNDAPESTVVDV